MGDLGPGRRPGDLLGRVPRSGNRVRHRAETWGLLPTIDGPYREFPSLVWTGSEVIAWGGSDNCERYLQDGVAADCNLLPLDDGFALRFLDG